MKAITDNTLMTGLANANNPVIIKFEAKWCQPCKAMIPMILDIEKELAGKVTFFSANVEHCMLMSQRYKISQVPALVALDKKGVITSIKTGAASRQEVLKWIDLALPGVRDA
jgi:thioredoxin 1